MTMSRRESEEILQFMENIRDIGGTINIGNDGVIIQIHSINHIKDLLHKLESIYHARDRGF